MLRRRVRVDRELSVEVAQRFFHTRGLRTLERHKFGDSFTRAGNINRLHHFDDGGELLGRSRDDQSVLDGIRFDARAFVRHSSFRRRGHSCGEALESHRDFARSRVMQINHAQFDGTARRSLFESREQFLDDGKTLGRRGDDDGVGSSIGNDACAHLHRRRVWVNLDRNSLRASLAVELQRLREHAHGIFRARRGECERSNDGFFGARW